MSTAWYVRLDSGAISGPYSETQIRSGLRSGKIEDGMRIRQGNSSWICVSKVRQLFANLHAQGMYVRFNDRVHGPFTRSRLDTITPGLPPESWIREGIDGAWQPFHQQSTDGEFGKAKRSGPRSFPLENSSQQPNPPANSGTARKVPAAPVMKLRTPNWKHTVEGLVESFENIFLGDPLSN